MIYNEYFKIFKFSEDNLVNKAFYIHNDRTLYVYSAKVFLGNPLNTCYDFRVKNLYIASGWYHKDDYPYIIFYRSNYDFRNLKGKWCSIIVNDISIESKPIVLEELYNKLGNLENPEEDQIACYTFLINSLNGTYS